MPTTDEDVRRVAPFLLHTHCGIRGAMIGGQWWAASPVLADPNGGPPAGWDDPTQAGEIRYTDDQTAVFTTVSNSGTQLSVTLLRTSRTEYPFICS